MHTAKMMVTAAAAGIADRVKSQGEKGRGQDDWTPAFLLEDFPADRKSEPAKTGRAEEDSSSSGDMREKQRHARGGRVSLDLNAEPEPDGVPA